MSKVLLVWLLTLVGVGALLIIEVRAHRRYLQTASRKSASTLDASLLLPPFLAFLFPNQFMLACAGFFAISVLGYFTAYLLNGRGELDHSCEAAALFLAGELLLITALRWLIIGFGEDAQSSAPAGLARVPAATGWLYAGGIGAALLISLWQKALFWAGLVLAATLTLTPLAMQHYFAALGLGLLAYGLCLPMLNRQRAGEKRGIGYLELITPLLVLLPASLLSHWWMAP